MNYTKPTQISVVSGKGGTGKTTVLGSFAVLADNKVLADCDVDAANLHLILQPNIKEEKPFFGAKIAVREDAKCIHCGAAEVRCRFDAISYEEMNSLACEGCGLCTYVCPVGALTLQSVKSGDCYVSETQYGYLVHAKLLPGGESSGRLVTLVRQQVEDIAIRENKSLILIDGPPGIGCTATASLVDVDLVLVVTEPTLSGLHDMQRVVRLIQHFRQRSAVIVNKFDLNMEVTREIYSFCRQYDVPVVGEIPFDECVTSAIAAGKPLVEYSEGPAATAVREVWDSIMFQCKGS